MLHNTEVTRSWLQKLFITALGLLVLGCSGGAAPISTQADPTQTSVGLIIATDSTVASATTVTSANLPTTTTSGGVSLLAVSGDPTLQLDHTSNAPTSDAFAPSVMPDTPMGRIGYTRYVFTRSGEQIIPALIEGPRASQTRCQKVELPC